MAWQIEKEYVDLAEMKHRTVYVEPNVATADGKLARHVDDILLGAHGAGGTRGANSSNLVLATDGTLYEPDGKTPVDVKKRQQEMLTRLTGLHSAARAFAQKNGKQLLRPKATR